MKLFFAYVRVHVKMVLLLALYSAIFGVVFLLYDLPAEPVGYAGLLCASVSLPFMVVGYLRFKGKHVAMERLLAQIGESIDNLPRPNNILERDYQRLLHELFKCKQAVEAELNTNYGDMTDYYTLWAHQIKTPIAAMNLLLQADRSEGAQELREQLFKIEQYVEMVLGYLRIESTTKDLLLKSYPLDTIVRQAVKKYAKQFIRKKISLEYDALDCHVLTDEKWLVFVIEQLLSNALKYTQSGKVTIKMADTEGDTLLITDTGIGIAPEDLPRLGEKGYTGYNGRMFKKSTGIGLFLCKRVLEMLSHTIKIESKPAKGTTVKIHFVRENIMDE